ncbi:MAG: OB-fold nucleic acid binding domain-containing protein, partial [Dehalococcoidia bacterium]
YRPVGRQLAFDMPVEQDMVALPEPSEWEVMTGEYRTMGLHPRGHVMAKLRPHLPRGVIRSVDIADYPEGASIRVAGVVIRRQRPLAKAVFITLEDEFGHSPLVIWPQVYRKLRQVARAPILLARGKVSHRDGTLNVVVTGLQPLDAAVPLSKSKDWG